MMESWKQTKTSHSQRYASNKKRQTISRNPCFIAQLLSAASILKSVTLYDAYQPNCGRSNFTDTR